MRTIYVSPEFPLNRRMRKDVRRGKLQVVREGGERSPLGGGIPSGKGRGLRTTGSRLVCMADNGAEVGGGGGGDEVDDESETGFEIVRTNAREIFEGRVQFRIPMFQRDYVWGSEQWEDFWVDVSGSRPKYQGGIVLRDDGGGRYEVIDGQQRLTTISLLVISALRILHDSRDNGGLGVPRNHSVCSELADAFIVNGGNLGGEIGRNNMKIIPYDPQWNGDGLFMSRLMSIQARQPGGEFHPYHERGRTSQIQMKKSVKDFFMGKLRGLNLTTPEAVRDFILKRMGDNLVFSRVVAAHNEGAHAIFETLNGRGRALGVAEIIKCYFMSFMDDTDAEEFGREWDDIRSQLDGAGLKGGGNTGRGNKELVGFIWAVYVCKYGAVPRQRLFRETAKKVHDQNSVREFFEMMKEQIKVYVQILAPTREFWGREFDKVDGLRCFGVSKGRAPFIMAVRRHMGENAEAFSESLRICYAVALRLKICGHPQGTDHNLPGVVFNRLSYKIWNASQLAADDVLDDPDLGDLYHKKADFAASFEKYALPAPQGRLSESQFGVFAHFLRMLEVSIDGKVDRVSSRKPKDYVVRCYSGNQVRHRLSEYCLQPKQGEEAFQTTTRTSNMNRDERGEQLGKWAAEVRNWRVDRYEAE